MKKITLNLTFLMVLLSNAVAFGKDSIKNNNFRSNEYSASLVFPANYSVGDYIEFVKVNPIDAGSSGYYYISISYTRGNIAAAATHVAAISHSNPNMWRETGRISVNKYVDSQINFTVDCNPATYNSSFRIRAVATHGVPSDIAVNVKIWSVNFNSSFSALNITGNDASVQKFLPMTNEWDLYVGNMSSYDDASIAIKALQNGNVGIGTATPKEKLSVNGKIRAHEVKVETANWPDYVFEDSYRPKTLPEIEKFIKENKHLPEVPSAKEVEQNGLALGEMNKILLKKIEELTLILIEKEKELKAERNVNERQSKDIKRIFELLDKRL